MKSDTNSYNHKQIGMNGPHRNKLMHMPIATYKKHMHGETD